MTRTLGASLGALRGRNAGQSGLESRMSSLMSPWNSAPSERKAAPRARSRTSFADGVLQETNASTKAKAIVVIANFMVVHPLRWFGPLGSLREHERDDEPRPPFRRPVRTFDPVST